MKKIQLTNNKVALVDDEDYTYISQWKWYADKIGNTYYAKRRFRENRKSTTISMHRAILVNNGGNYIDHKDGDGLNNQRVNLRVCSKSQNQWNRKKDKRNKSGFTGVSFDKIRNKWVAQITTNYKRTHIGRFDTAEKAAMAYNSVAIKMHGEFAVVNKV